MYTPEALLDLHERTHRSLIKLIEHCGKLSTDELNRELPGFGFPSVKMQLLHTVGAEYYWISVARGDFDSPESIEALLGDYDESRPEVLARYVDTASIESYRQKVAALTEEYFRGADSAGLSSPRELYCWPGKLRSLVPAHVIARIFTHIFHHQGQVLAMCRSLGQPYEGHRLDFALD